MGYVLRWSVAGFLAGFVAVGVALYLYWPVGIVVGLAVGITLLAVIQRRLLAEERAEYLEGRGEVDDLLGALISR
jgi:hypothetical protein